MSERKFWENERHTDGVRTIARCNKSGPQVDVEQVIARFSLFRPVGGYDKKTAFMFTTPRFHHFHWYHRH